MPSLPRLLAPDYPAFPARLRALDPPPSELWVLGDVRPAPTVAIVGSRESYKDAEEFAQNLAFAVASTGAVVVSGGAEGIDAAAHQGALRARGRTWCVAPTGFREAYPAQHSSLFESIPDRGGAMLWPFPPDATAQTYRFFQRNRVLVALADAVVVVQADLRSGARNAARWARELGRPLWVVPGPPWLEKYAGCLLEIERGARMLVSIQAFLREQLGVSLGPSTTPPPPSPDDPTTPARPLTEDEQSILSALTRSPRHVEEIARLARLPLPTLSTLLLTLALENVVVEGPHGFFRRADIP